MKIVSLNIEIHIDSVNGDFQPDYHVITTENVVIKRKRNGVKQVKSTSKKIGM